MALRAYLYQASGHDHEIGLDDVTTADIDEQSLLWIDLDNWDDADLDRVAEKLDISRDCFVRRADTDRDGLDNFGSYFRFGVNAAPQHGAPNSEGPEVQVPPLDTPAEPGSLTHGTPIEFIVGQRWLVTIHEGPVACLNRFRGQDKAETMIGLLTPQALAGSLLDWHLGAYFEEVSLIEATVDRLDERVLRETTSHHLLGRMVAMRRRVSRLRALLVRQRDVFYGLSRPDFALVTDSGATPFFQALAGRFERALDEVERARDLVTGSFELFTSRSSQQTNDLVKVLTFLTAIIGFCAAVAGLLGMNFQLAFFQTGLRGFVAVTGGLMFVAAVSVIYARHRSWI